MKYGYIRNTKLIYVILATLPVTTKVVLVIEGQNMHVV